MFYRMAPGQWGRGVRGEELVQVPVGEARLEGALALPTEAGGVVLFAHGSGSSRHSPRNRFVAAALRQAGLGTMLVDLLTPDEEDRDRRTRELRFDIELLADRLVALMDWLAARPTTASRPVGLFGASTGAGAALVAAARRPAVAGAVVSRGGRPDLAGPALAAVRAPTLMIVGGRDPVVLDLNEQARQQLVVPSRLEVVPGASHLFEEPGTLEQVAALAASWFGEHLGGTPPPGTNGDDSSRLGT